MQRARLDWLSATNPIVVVIIEQANCRGVRVPGAHDVPEAPILGDHYAIEATCIKQVVRWGRCASAFSSAAKPELI